MSATPIISPSSGRIILAASARPLRAGAPQRPGFRRAAALRAGPDHGRRLLDQRDDRVARHAGGFGEWVAAGAAGWGWDDVLPHYRRLERDLDFAGPLHGADGRSRAPAPARAMAGLLPRGGRGGRGPPRLPFRRGHERRRGRTAIARCRSAACPSSGSARRWAISPKRCAGAPTCISSPTHMSRKFCSRATLPQD